MSTPETADSHPVPTLRKDRVRILFLICKREDISYEDFQRYWLEHASVFISEAVKSNLCKYEQQHVSQESKITFEKMGMKMAQYDGIAVMEAESFESIIQVLTDKDFVARSDSDKFVNWEKTVSVLPMNFGTFWEK
ncbi:hypothetical protein K435DRAFT_972186 [Dendrothele bispora CBS 962.96]|uniref:EthD domain-containing protein n=1 Tax=Dendrothele bispora (strain CBS 962.96) TaxID=1314807 RepID=A0A4S8L0J4_DENBC|nr:hypothetical protein K435DRAFT_972186 [Dendrothele bispora CBS 962.96]